VLRFLPPLRIHIWGGLGSQLFGVSVAHDLSNRFRGRKIKLVLHTSGVTHRVPEVIRLFPAFDYELRDDYSGAKLSENSSGPALIDSFRVLLKKSMRFLFFLQTANDDDEFSRVKVWTISLRGHYSYRSITHEFYCFLEKSIREVEGIDSVDQKSTCVIHYRLGDLLELQEKSPIPVEVIFDELEKARHKLFFIDVVIFSDSPKVALERFSNLAAEKVSAPEANTFEVLANSIRADYFIGTSSKISFWIAGLRASIFESSSSLPISNDREYRNMLHGARTRVTGYPRET